MSDMDRAEVMKVIKTALTRRGEGKAANDPIRVVTQYWSLEGELLAEVDQWRDKLLRTIQEQNRA